jgi:Zn-finger nucleic acid-binding protein
MATRAREGIEVDVCAQCGGLWLDAGELTKIIDLERAQTDATTRADWRMYDRGRDSYDPTPEPERTRGTFESLLGS